MVATVDTTQKEQPKLLLLVFEKRKKRKKKRGMFRTYIALAICDLSIPKKCDEITLTG